MSVRIYEYKCADGHRSEYALRPEDSSALSGTMCRQCQCGFKLPLRRVFSFSKSTTFQAHYSPFLGQRIDSEAQFRNALSRSSDEATAKTGIPCKYVPRDLRDLRAPESSHEAEAALKSTHDLGVSSGRIDSTREVFHG